MENTNQISFGSTQFFSKKGNLFFGKDLEKPLFIANLGISKSKDLINLIIDKGINFANFTDSQISEMENGNSSHLFKLLGLK
jgi:hypothetical protein